MTRPLSAPTTSEDSRAAAYIGQIRADGPVHRLRELQLDDIEWIHRAGQDSAIQRWTAVPRPYTREHAESFVSDHAGRLSTWVILRSPSGEPVGVIGLHHVEDGIATVGYWVAPWARGRGAATDALRRLQEIITRETDARTVRALIAETNIASRRRRRRVRDDGDRHRHVP